MIKIYKNFLNIEECNKLNEITLQGVREGWIFEGVQSGRHGYKLRYTSRMYMKNFEYPQFVMDVSNKIRSFLGINNYYTSLKQKRWLFKPPFLSTASW